MRPTTRSMSARFSFDDESIRHTKDPLQVTFDSSIANLPLWRFVLFERYCGTYKPPQTSTIFKEFSKNNQHELDIPTQFNLSLPTELWHSFIQVFLNADKILTIHTYYSSGKILIQGHVCQEWVHEEFEKLKCIVAQLSTLNTSPESAPDVLNRVTSTLSITTPVSVMSEEDTSFHSLLVEVSDCIPPPSSTDKSPSPSPAIPLPSPTERSLSPQPLTSSNDETTSPPPHQPIGTPSPSTDLPPDSPHPSPTSRPHTDHYPQPPTPQLSTDAQATSPTASSLTTAHLSQGTPLAQQCDTPSSLLPLTSAQTIIQLQTQLSSAMLTISSMQKEIQTLKHQLAETTQQTEENTQNINNAEVRVKNSVKTAKQELTQQIQETCNGHKNLQSQLKETTNKLHSFKDSQNNINTDIKKQLQTLSTVKHTQHSGSQTDSTHSESDTLSVETDSAREDEYTIVTSNRYAALSDSSTKDHCASTTVTGTTSTHKEKNHDNITNSTKRTNTKFSTANDKHNTPLPSPLAILMQKTVPPSCDTLLLGDSVLEGVDERKMSADGNKVRNLSVSGLTVHHLCQWLTSRPPSPHIRQVTFHVGINSCDRGPVSTTDWVRLISLLRQAFPSAALQASSVLPPLGQHPLKEAASRSTVNLRHSCLQEGVVYIDNTPSFLAKSGAPKKAMYQDRIHPSAQGYKFLALNIRFPGNHQRRTPPASEPQQNNPLLSRRDQTNRPTPADTGDIDAVRRGRRRVVNDPFPNLKKSTPAATTKVTGTGPKQDPVHEDGSPTFDYYREFPINVSKNPMSRDVYNVLGQHHSLQQQTINSDSVIRLLAEMLRPFIKQLFIN